MSTLTSILNDIYTNLKDICKPLTRFRYSKEVSGCVFEPTVMNLRAVVINNYPRYYELTLTFYVVQFLDTPEASFRAAINYLDQLELDVAPVLSSIDGILQYYIDSINFTFRPEWQKYVAVVTYKILIEAQEPVQLSIEPPPGDTVQIG